MSRTRLTQEGLKSGAQARVSSELINKASKCIKVARLMLGGSKADKTALEQQASALMDVREADLDATYARLTAGQNAPDAFDTGTYPDTHSKVKPVDELRESKGKRSSASDKEGCGCPDHESSEETIVALSDVPLDELEAEVARRAAGEGKTSDEMTEEEGEPMPEVEETSDDNEVVEDEEVAKTMATNAPGARKSVNQPSTARRAGDVNDPAQYAGRENEIDLPSVAEKSARLSVILREAPKYGKSGVRLASLSSKVAQWAINPTERGLMIAAENAAALANMLRPARSQSKYAANLFRLASEVADGMISPDTGEPDQENEVNQKFDTNYEAPASDSEKAMSADLPKGASSRPRQKRADEANPAEMVAPKDAPEERSIPKDDESTSDELPGHSASGKRKPKRADDLEVPSDEEVKDELLEELTEEAPPAEGEAAPPPVEEAPPAEGEAAPPPVEEAPMEEPIEEEIELQGGDSSIDAALAASDEEDEGLTQGASDEEVLDVLFEEDEEKAAAKMAALRKAKAAQPGMKKAASVLPKKVGAKKLGMGPKVASAGRSEIQMLEKAIWTSKPDVSKFFGQHR